MAENLPAVAIFFGITYAILRSLAKIKIRGWLGCLYFVLALLAPVLSGWKYRADTPGLHLLGQLVVSAISCCALYYHEWQRSKNHATESGNQNPKAIINYTPFAITVIIACLLIYLFGSRLNESSQAAIPGSGDAWQDEKRRNTEVNDQATLEMVIAKAKSGDKDAQFDLGEKYFTGQGVPRNETQATQWWRKAAEQGNADAQHWLGNAYYSGRGVPEDYTQAALWWHKAAEQGSSAALFSLCSAFYTGVGFPKDKVAAYALCNLAATASKPKAGGMSISLRTSIAGGMTKKEIEAGQALTRKIHNEGAINMAALDKYIAQSKTKQR